MPGSKISQFSDNIDDGCSDNSTNPAHTWLHGTHPHVVIFHPVTQWALKHAGRDRHLNLRILGKGMLSTRIRLSVCLNRGSRVRLFPSFLFPNMVTKCVPPPPPHSGDWIPWLLHEVVDPIEQADCCPRAQPGRRFRYDYTNVALASW